MPPDAALTQANHRGRDRRFCTSQNEGLSGGFVRRFCTPQNVGVPGVGSFGDFARRKMRGSRVGLFGDFARRKMLGSRGWVRSAILHAAKCWGRAGGGFPRYDEPTGLPESMDRAGQAAPGGARVHYSSSERSSRASRVTRPRAVLPKLGSPVEFGEASRLVAGLAKMTPVVRSQASMVMSPKLPTVLWNAPSPRRAILATPRRVWNGPPPANRSSGWPFHESCPSTASVKSGVCVARPPWSCGNWRVRAGCGWVPRPPGARP
jgi:hypothetical protein